MMCIYEGCLLFRLTVKCETLTFKIVLKYFLMDGFNNYLHHFSSHFSYCCNKTKPELQMNQLQLLFKLA